MTTYLVQYGRQGYVGRFQSTTFDQLETGDRVIVHSPRGIELGIHLCQPAPRFADSPIDGELLRLATTADEACTLLQETHGHAILLAAEERAERDGLAISFIDIEMLIDGTSILHALPWGECDATALLDELSSRFGLGVRLLDLSWVPKNADGPELGAAGCGKPGCGSTGGGCSSCGTGGGCSTGSCSKGKVSSAKEMTAYFSDLRQKMEAQSAMRTPLV